MSCNHTAVPGQRRQRFGRRLGDNLRRAARCRPEHGADDDLQWHAHAYVPRPGGRCQAGGDVARPCSYCSTPTSHHQRPRPTVATCPPSVIMFDWLECYSVGHVINHMLMQAIYDYDPEWGEPSTLSTSIGEIVGFTPEACMLRSGDMVLMDAKVFHFGGANESPRRRFLLQFSFLGPGIFGSHTSRPPEFTYHLDSSAGEQHIYHSHIYQCAFILRPRRLLFSRSTNCQIGQLGSGSSILCATRA